MAYAFSPRPTAAAVRTSAPAKRDFAAHVSGFDDLKARASALVQAAQQLSNEVGLWCQDSNSLCLQMENDPEFQTDPTIRELEQQVFELNGQVNDIVPLIENAFLAAG